MSIPKGLRSFLALLSAVAYIGFIIYIGLLSVQTANVVVADDGKESVADPPSIPSEITTLLSIMGTALAVHTGTVLGIEILEPNEEKRERRRSGRLNRSSLWKRRERKPGTGSLREIGDALLKLSLTNLADLGALIYVAGLVIAVLFFFIGEGLHESAAPFLRDSWTALVGVFAGIWSVRPQNTVPVPDLVPAGSGLTRAQATDALEAHGLKPKWTTEGNAASGPEWIVWNQNPEASQRVAPGEEVEAHLRAA